MDLNNLNLSVAMPEIVLLVALFGIVLADLWIKDEDRYITHYLSIGAMFAAAFGQWAVWVHEPAVAFNGMYIADGISQFAKIVVYFGVATLFVYAKPYNQQRQMFYGEYYILAIFAVVGMIYWFRIIVIVFICDDCFAPTLCASK